MKNILLKYYCYSIIVIVLYALVSGCSPSPRKDIDFFDGKSLSGWTSAQPEYWHVEDSCIIGKSTEEISRNQFIWSSVKVKDFYLSVDILLDSPDCNAGIQFRSAKIDDYGQAMGYQADIGKNFEKNIWGSLYYEDGRGLLQSVDSSDSPVKSGDWNHYEILAIGHQIWIAINGQIVSATEDFKGDKEGYIALQIHSGPPQTVRYKINELIHHPGFSLAGKSETALKALLRRALVPVPGEETIHPDNKATIAFAGGTNMVNMMEDGYLETILSTHYKNKQLKFRNIAWEGDQVNEQFRDVGFGSWLENIDSINPQIVFIQFGQMESLEGENMVPEFIQHYTSLLDSLEKRNKQVVILSPIEPEPNLLTANDETLLMNPLTNTAGKKYFDAIQLMAQKKNYPFVDLYWTLRNIQQDVTYDGLHLNDYGQQVAAEIIRKSLGITTSYTEEMQPLRQAIIDKNKIWFDYWRPGNWAFLKGDRTDQAFGRHWKERSQRLLLEEINQIAPLLNEAEEKIHSISKGKKHSIETPNHSPVPVKNEDINNSVKEELASFRLHKDYNIELYASEELGIADPSTMRWDEKGRLWVLCIPTYPQPLPGQRANDKLIVLEDKDNDGKADVSTVFAENLNIPLGFELGHDGVYLGEQTKLLHLKDTNNDLRYDTRKTLFSGFGTHDSHQTINSFIWSPGGELFFAQGLSIYSYVETAYGVKKAKRGGLWRYRPRTHELDNILDQSTASDNPWGMNFGNWGEYFTKSNDTGIYFSSPALVLSNHKALVPEIGATQIKSGIIEIARSKHLPADINGDFLVAGYYNNKIERFKIEEDGAGYKARMVEPLLASTGKNFRPVDIKIGPDGAIYILDWYNPIIGHYQASLRDPQRDKTKGRVWRITAKNRPLLNRPQLENQSISTLLDFLKSDEYWVRYQTHRLIAAKKTEEVLPALTQWVKNLNPNEKKYEHHLMEAIAVHAAFEIINEGLLNKLLKSKHEGARGYAAEIAGRWATRLTDPLKTIEPLLSDRHPRVRLMALVACSQIHRPEAMKAAVKILNFPMDKFTVHSLEKTVHALSDSWAPSYQNKTVQFNTDYQLAVVISILTPEWYSASMYKDLLKKSDYPSAIKTKLLSALANIGSTDDIEYVLSQPGAQQNIILLEELTKKEVSSITPSISNSIQQILSNPVSEDHLLVAIKLARTWKINSVADDIKTIVLRDNQKDKIIAAGIRTLTTLQYPQLTTILNDFINSKSRQIRLACINGYAKINAKKGAEEIVKEIKKGSADVYETGETLINIIFESGGIEALADEIHTSELSSQQANAALIALELRHITDKNLLTAFSKFENDQKPIVPKEYDGHFVEQLKQKTTNASAINGQKVYKALGCGACHKIANEGGDIGPNLSAIGSGLSTSDIIIEVLWPNKNIKEGFNTIRLDLKNGESIQGIKVLETSDAISVKPSASASPEVFSKKDITEIIPVGSAMPAAMANNITEEELANLIKYLTSLRGQ